MIPCEFLSRTTKRLGIIAFVHHDEGWDVVYKASDEKAFLVASP
jgi:hypothetical protein